MTQQPDGHFLSTTTPSGDPNAARFSSVGGIFTVAGVSFQPVSPKLVTVRLVATALWLGLPAVGLAIGAAFLNRMADPVWPAWLSYLPALIMAILTGWVAMIINRQVRSIGWAEAEEELLIRRGVFFRCLSVVPYGRLQFIDINQGPIDRSLGIATVQLHTASASSDATVPGVPIAAATALRERLTQRGKSRMAGL